MRDMSHTSFEYLWINTKLASTTKPPSVRRPVTEASQPRNASDHKLAKLERLLRSMLVHPDQSIDWRSDKTSPTQSTGDCLPVLPSIKLPKYDLDFPQIEGHLDWG